MVAELHGRPVVRSPLDEEEGSIGGGVAIDVDPSQDDGSHQEDGQHNAHDGAQVQRGPRRLGGQVVLKAVSSCVGVHLGVVFRGEAVNEEGGGGGGEVSVKGAEGAVGRGRVGVLVLEILTCSAFCLLGTAVGQPLLAVAVKATGTSCGH